MQSSPVKKYPKRRPQAKTSKPAAKRGSKPAAEEPSDANPGWLLNAKPPAQPSQALDADVSSSLEDQLAVAKTAIKKAANLVQPKAKPLPATDPGLNQDEDSDDQHEDGKVDPYALPASESPVEATRSKRELRSLSDRGRQPQSLLASLSKHKQLPKSDGLKGVKTPAAAVLPCLRRDKGSTRQPRQAAKSAHPTTLLKSAQGRTDDAARRRKPALQPQPLTEAVRPRAKRERVQHEACDDDDEDEGEEGEAGGGASLGAVLGSMMAKISQDGQDSDDEGQDDGMADLQRTLLKVVKSKKDNARQKQKAMLEGARGQIAARVQEVAAGVQAEAQQTAELAVRSYANLSQQLGRRAAEMQQAEEEHRAQQDQRLRKYKELYDKTKPMKEELESIVKQQQRGAKRKLGELQTFAQQLIADAEAQAHKCQKRASRLPQVARLLKALV
ncbi:hypothetical protein WJX73_005437 [Symbiochloris irregularis]|uniref:Uncharacterized protein n=1 Tax=Symbiochloris irregularis TaxID=706552 RepID=A0AAW1PYA3_9CHLO